MPKNNVELFSRGNGTIRKELITDVVLTPGTRVQLLSTGHITNVLTPLVKSPTYHALEDSYSGKTITTDYAIGDVVQVLVGSPGDRINGLVLAGQVIVIGDLLEQTASGVYQKLTTGVPVMMALEAVSPVGTNALAEMEVI